MFLHIAGQFPGAIAQGGMGVFFILGKRTGQSLGIRRFLHRLKARIRVLMLQNLDFAADQIARFLQAASGVFVEKDFRFSADQHRFRCNLGWFGGQVTSQHLIPCIAVIAVLVLITLLQAAYQSAGFRVAIIRMHMLCTSQFVALHDVARICMDMGFFCFRYGIAAVRMRMCRNLRQRAPKVPIFVIACRIMLVNDKVCIPARQVSFAVIAGIVMLMEIQAFDGTHRLGPGGRGYLRVASLRMGVFRNLTRSLFHGNGGKNQCVDRAEHHNAGKTGYNPVPAFFSFMRFHIFFCAL